MRNNILDQPERTNVRFEATNEEKLKYFTQMQKSKTKKQEEGKKKRLRKVKQNNIQSSNYDTFDKNDMVFSASIKNIKARDSYKYFAKLNKNKQQKSNSNQTFSKYLPCTKYKEIAKAEPQKVQEQVELPEEPPSQKFLDFERDINLFYSETLSSQTLKNKWGNQDLKKLFQMFEAVSLEGGFLKTVGNSS